MGRGVAIAVAFALIAVTGWLYRSGAQVEVPEAGTSSTPSSRAPARSRPDVVLTIAPGAGRTPSPGAGAQALTPLMAEFGKRRDYKALHDRITASSLPSAEELYVLASIMERCATLAGQATPRDARWRLGGQESLDKFVAALPAKAANREKRIAAFGKLNHDPCAGLEGLKVTDAEIDALLRRAADAGDPKAQARLFTRSVERHMRKGPSNFFEVSDEDEATIRRVMQSSDPNAIVDLVTVLGYNYANLNLRTGPDREPVDTTALMFASHLAACDLGYPCGADAPTLLQACAFSGQCDAASYRDHLFFYHSSPATSQLATEYHHHLMRVIRDGDWSYFTIHRGPSPAFAPFQRG